MENSDVKLLTVCVTVCLPCALALIVVNTGYVMDGNGEIEKEKREREDQSYPSCGRTVMALKG